MTTKVRVSDSRMSVGNTATEPIGQRQPSVDSCSPPRNRSETEITRSYRTFRVRRSHRYFAYSSAVAWGEGKSRERFQGGGKNEKFAFLRSQLQRSVLCVLITKTSA